MPPSTELVLRSCMYCGELTSRASSVCLCCTKFGAGVLPAPVGSDMTSNYAAGSHVSCSCCTSTPDTMILEEPRTTMQERRTPNQPWYRTVPQRRKKR